MYDATDGPEFTSERFGLLRVGSKSWVIEYFNHQIALEYDFFFTYFNLTSLTLHLLIAKIAAS